MAARKWLVGHSYGYVGTDSEEEIDVVENGMYSEEELASKTNDELEKELADGEWEVALEQVEAWAKPVD